MKDYKFCPICGASGLESKKIEDRNRMICGKCGWIDYRNPIPVIACLVSNSKGELLLIKRNVEPSRGRWALPGGFIEVGETLQEAGCRELCEETGLESKPGRLVGAHMQKSQMYGFVLVVGMVFTVENEDIRPGDDAADAKFIPAEDIPDIPFISHRKLIEEFFEL
ncbi:MAG: NUDIX hydrolase [Candidatus Omnitrophota bacterium]